MKEIYAFICMGIILFAILFGSLSYSFYLSNSCTIKAIEYKYDAISIQAICK